MKVIDLLVKIANGEEVPSPIYHNDLYYDFEDGDYFNQKTRNWLFNDSDIDTILNDEVKIIEEDKKIEIIEENNSINHLVNYAGFETFTNEVKLDYLYEMITRIIDKINEMEDK